MKTKTLTISILLLAMVLTPLAMAQPGGGPRGGHGPRGGGYGGHPGPSGDMGGFLLGRLADKLELTEEQRAEIKAIMEGTQPEAQEAREAVGEAMKALHEATADGTEAEIVAAGKAVGDAMTEQALLRAATMKQIKEVLTDEQLAKFEELKAEMRERMQQRREEGGPRQGGKRHGGHGGGRRGPQE
ncbi:MAG: Spy/CpxP family protein refolding chaperone [Planctomycetota bacterium]